MRYPVLSAADAAIFLHAKRSGDDSDIDRMTRARGDGKELGLDFVDDLREELEKLRAQFPEGIKSAKDGNRFEALASRVVHQGVPYHAEPLADPEFWVWLATVHFREIIEWRYGNPEGGAKVANYGVGAKGENFLYRLWLRADLVLDEGADDRYHLSQAGQVDFYRSHLYRQSYANARPFARALLRFQYPDPKSPTTPKLKVGEIRELVKRLRRLRANLFLEMLEESECRKVIEAEAQLVAGSV